MELDWYSSADRTSITSFNPGACDGQAKGGCRYGAFFQDIPAGMSLTSGRSIAAGEDINKEDKGVNEVVLRWKANGRAGVGWLTFRAGEWVNPPSSSHKKIQIWTEVSFQC